MADPSDVFGFNFQKTIDTGEVGDVKSKERK